MKENFEKIMENFKEISYYLISIFETFEGNLGVYYENTMTVRLNDIITRAALPKHLFFQNLGLFSRNMRKYALIFTKICTLRLWLHIAVFFHKYLRMIPQKKQIALK